MVDVVSVIGGNWTTGATWVDLSSPTAADDAQASSLSGNFTIDNGGAVCRSLDTDTFTGILTHNASSNLTIGDATAGAGNIALRLDPGLTYTLGSATTSALIFASTSTTQQTITTSGKTLGNITINGVGGKWTPTDTLTSSGALTITNGAYDNSVSNVAHSIGTIAVTGSAARTLNLGAATWTLTSTATGNIWSISFASNLTFSGASATIVIANASSNLRTFVGQGQAYGTITYTVAGSTGGLNFTGSNTIGRLNFSDVTNARSLLFTAGTTNTFTNFNVNGTPSKLMTVGSITAANHTLHSTSTQVCDYLSISRSTATGGPWYAGSHSTDGGNNSGWIFTDPPRSGGGIGLQSRRNLQNLQKL